MIRISGLTKAYGDRVLLNGIDFHFRENTRYGLVGANGAGKSTLLKILAGDESADSGERVAPRHCVVSHLPQAPHPEPLASLVEECMTGHSVLYERSQKLQELGRRLAEEYSEEIQLEFESAEAQFRLEGGYALEADARALLSGLGFQQAELSAHPLSFSGGWRMRLELAKILICRPDFLILDEPTNHLDLPSIAWLEKRLRQFEGTLVFVSHDRSLLNRLSTRVLHLNGGHLKEYVGDFDAYLEASERERESNVKQKVRLAEQAQHLERFAERFGAKATMAARAKSKLKMAARIRALEQGIEIEAQDQSFSLKLTLAQRSSREVLRLRALTVGYRDPLFQPLDLLVERGMRIAVLGANGSGKSTLLKTLVGEQDPLSGDLVWGDDVQRSYFAQDQAEALDGLLSVKETLLSSYHGIDEKMARQLLGAMNFRDLDVDKPVHVLSGGEKNRLGLTCLLAGSANVLILDEPTNHLDMASVEILSDALSQFEGTVLFVSHHRDFVDQVCTHILSVSRSGEVGLFQGNIEDYQRACVRSGFPDVLSFEESTRDEQKSQRPFTDTGVESRTSWEERKEQKRAELKNARRLEAIERRLEELASQRTQLEEKIIEAAHDFARARELSTDVQRIQDEVERLEQEWLERSE